MYKILMIDDNFEMVKLFTEYLKTENILLDSEADGFSGSDKALSDNYDLIIMDVNMPLLDGINATKKIRHLEKKRNYICAFTAFPEQNGIKSDNLFDAVISKGSASLLLKSIKSILKKQIAI